MASKRVISIADSLIVSGAFLLLLWAIHAIAWVTGADLSWLGVLPRSLSGLLGILTMPLVHGDWGHLMSNSVPILVLGAGIIFFYPKIAVRSIGLMWLGTGLFTRGGRLEREGFAQGKSQAANESDEEEFAAVGPPDMLRTVAKRLYRFCHKASLQPG